MRDKQMYAGTRKHEQMTRTHTHTQTKTNAQAHAHGTYSTRDTKERHGEKNLGSTWDGNNGKPTIALSKVLHKKWGVLAMRRLERASVAIRNSIRTTNRSPFQGTCPSAGVRNTCQWIYKSLQLSPMLINSDLTRVILLEGKWNHWNEHLPGKQYNVQIDA